MKLQQLSKLVAISTVTTAACALSLGKAEAATIVLDFEGVGNNTPIGNFYNGGAGTNYGIEFSSTALGLVDSDAGGGGNFANEPSPDTIMFFSTGSAATMNVAAGFNDGFSFFYTAISNPGSVNVYDGLNSTGNLLATLTLGLTPQTSGGDPNGTFNTFVPIGVNFNGTAKSVDFGGVAGQIGIDNVTLGSAIAGGSAQVPEPFTIIGTLVGGTAAIRMRKNLNAANKA